MRCAYQAHNHPSDWEAKYCLWLEARRQAGEIKGFDWQFVIPLTVNGKPWKSWACDFKVFENDGTISAHEAKGFNRSDDTFRLKLSICMLCHPDLPVYVNKVRVKFTPKGRIIIRPARKRVWPKRSFKQQRGQ